MGRVQQPYYNLHQITTGQYTNGGEFVLRNGEIYIGSYHVLPTQQRFTGFRPEPGSVELFELRLNPTDDILRYNRLTGNTINKYVSPQQIQPEISDDDYGRGRIDRLFVQKRNSPQNTITEIDYLQYNSINTSNNEGISGVTWNSCNIEWIISKISKADAAYLNEISIKRVLPAFPHLDAYLTDLSEFYR